MKEVTGPIIATSLVLAGVFIPIALISGLTGQFYQQFRVNHCYRKHLSRHLIH